MTSPLKRLRRATTVTKGANVGLASLKPADLKIAGSAACGSYIQGYTTGVLGGALLFLGPHFGLTPAQIGAVATATTLGSVLGTFSASALADAAGRRPTMAFSSALFVVASVLMVWTPAAERPGAGAASGWPASASGTAAPSCPCTSPSAPRPRRAARSRRCRSS